jgi:DNA polymerase-3 subunit delta'
MSQKTLKDLLLSKYIENKASHFYLINNTDNTQIFENKLNLEKWIEKLLSEIAQKFSATSFSNHADILIIGKEKDQHLANLEQTGSNYNVDDLTEINRFISHKALELPRKIIIIYHAHLLSEIVQNKLLKVLEEPDNSTIFFLLNPTGVSLLPTVESRSIQLRVKPSQELSHSDLVTNDQQQKLNLIEIIQQTPLHVFLEKFKNKEHEVIQSVISCLNDLPPSTASKGLEMLKWFEKSKAHYNSSQQRLFETYNLFKTNAK